MTTPVNSHATPSRTGRRVALSALAFGVVMSGPLFNPFQMSPRLAQAGRAALEAAWRASTVDPDDAPEGVICYQREKAAVTLGVCTPPNSCAPQSGAMRVAPHKSLCRAASGAARVLNG